MITICSICGSQDIKHEEKSGRGLAPKNHIKNGNKRTSWRGMWDIYTCNNCGNETKILRK